MTFLVIVVSAVLVLSCDQAHRHTDAQTHADERFTPATVVRLSNKAVMKCIKLYVQFNTV